MPCFVIGAAVRIGVVDGQLRLAAHIAVDDEIVCGRAGLAEKGIDSERRAAVRIEFEARSRHGEDVAHAVVHRRDQTRILEALEIDEGRLRSTEATARTMPSLVNRSSPSPKLLVSRASNMPPA